MAEVVSVRVAHKSIKVILNVLDDQVDTVNGRLLEVVLHHSRALLRAKIVYQVSEVRDIVVSASLLGTRHGSFTL